MQTNPYEILGVKQSDSVEYIESVYNNYMRLLHPDRAHTKESRKLGMTQEEKVKYMQIIRSAYSTILSTKKETKYPDYTKQYTIDNDVRINVAKELKGEFNRENFNAAFDNASQRDKKAGIIDAYSRGYEEFDKGKNYNSVGTLALPSYTDVEDVTKSRVYKNKDDRLIEYSPDIFDMGTGYQELGLTNVSNFSITTTGKTGLGGCDLMAVYGQNLEPWEQVAMRDPKLSVKFLDTEDVHKKMSKMESERGSVYDLPLDYKMLEAEKARNFALEQQEKIRMANTEYRDEYYNEINRGRLTDAPMAAPIVVPGAAPMGGRIESQMVGRTPRRN